MKATETKLLEFLRKSPQFSIPIYQRTYSWTQSQCRQLWDDIIRAGANDEISAHFIGSIVYIEQGLYQVSSGSPLLVIDGQQRLTTVSLIIEALARYLGDDEPIEGFSARKLRNYYLLNPEEADLKHYKLLLTQTDEQTLLAIINRKPLPSRHLYAYARTSSSSTGKSRSWVMMSAPCAKVWISSCLSTSHWTASKTTLNSSSRA